MKKIHKITFASLMAALAAVIMLAAYFPYLTIAVPAIAGLAVMLAFYEVGAPYALAAYLVSAALAVLFCEKESATLYVCLFGYYPVLKAFIEKIRFRAVEWAAKLALLNAAAVLSYYAAAFVFGIPAEGFGVLGKYGAIIILLMCSVAFVIYDFCLSALASEYQRKYRGRILKAFGFLKKK